MGIFDVFLLNNVQLCEQMDSCFLTVSQVAAKLQMHPHTVRRLLAAGKLPGVKVGGKEWRTPARALIVMMDAQANAREIKEFLDGLT
jgi:excisionase family DNA binding protein